MGTLELALSYSKYRNIVNITNVNVVNEYTKFMVELTFNTGRECMYKLNDTNYTREDVFNVIINVLKMHFRKCMVDFEVKETH